MYNMYYSYQLVDLFNKHCASVIVPCPRDVMKSRQDKQFRRVYCEHSHFYC